MAQQQWNYYVPPTNTASNVNTIVDSVKNAVRRSDQLKEKQAADAERKRLEDKRDLELNRKIYSYDEGAYTEDNIQYRAGFDRKQNKYMAVIPNNTQTPIPGEVVFGNQTSGIKAYYATVTMKTDATTDPNGLKELFAVGTTFAPR